MAKKVAKPNLVVGDTLILTNHGSKALKDIVDDVIYAWNGMDYTRITVEKVEEFDINDQSSLVQVDFDNGVSLVVSKSFRFDLTGNAKRRSKDLEPGMKLKGWKMPGATSDAVVVTDVRNFAKEQTDLYAVSESVLHHVVLNGIMVPDERG